MGIRGGVAATTERTSGKGLGERLGRFFGRVEPPVRDPGLFQYRDDEEIERPFNWAQFKRLLGYMGPHVWLTVGATCVTLLGAAMQLLRPYLLFLVVNNALRTHDLRRLNVYVGLYLVSFVVTWAASMAQTQLTARLGQAVLHDLRHHLYSHIQELSLTFFDRRPAGNILVRVTNDVNSLGDLFTSGIVTLLSNVFLLVGIVVVMLALKWNLALATFAIVPALLLISTGLRRQIRLGWQRVRRRLSRLNAHLNEAIQGMRVTQAFVREPNNDTFFQNINFAYYQTWMQTIRVSALFGPLVTLTGACGTAIVFLYGATLVRDGQVSVGIVVAFLQYVALFWQPISMLGNLYNSLLQAMASSERVFQFLDFRPEVADRSGAPDLPPVEGKVVFDHVSFAYEDGKKALDDVSFEVKAGQTVALVGHTGAGKTTVVSLLGRFYDPTEGRILVDGHDLREVSLSSLRRQVAMVLQETFLFSGTIGTNLRYGRLEAAQVELEKAARETGMHSHIASLPDNYGTEVQERGSRFSAGQRQLMAIARALLADPRILILDEATSSIDTHTELEVQAALGKLLKGRTAFVVAHRLSTIRRADLILVFDHGRIVEFGNHESLLASDGVYTSLIRAQFRFLEGKGAEAAVG